MRLALLSISISCAALAQNYAIQTVAGSFPLGNGGPAAQALLQTPGSVTADRAGTVFLTDSATTGIRAVLPSGVIQSFSDFPAATVFAEADGNLLAGSFFVLVRISREGRVTPVAGNGELRSTGDGGPALQAGLGFVAGIAKGADGSIYFSGDLNHVVRRIAPDGRISTVAGTGTVGSTGDNGPASQARLDIPGPLAVDASGNLYIGERNSGKIRKVDGNGQITTFAFNGFLGFPTPGPATSSPNGGMDGLAFDSQGDLLVVDGLVGVIVRISPAGQLTPFAGSLTTLNSGLAGDGGPAAGAIFNSPAGIAISGNSIYVADRGNHRIRKIEGGNISTLAGRSHFGGDGGQGSAAVLDSPRFTAIDQQGNAIVSDTNNHRLRRVTPQGVISTIAGTGDRGFAGDGGAATAARISAPGPVIVDPAGNIVFADTGNFRVRRIGTDGVIRTIAGNGTRGDRADGPATSAQIGSITGLALDSAGALYLSDFSFHRIRKVADNNISNIAGTGTAGFSGDGGLATVAQVSAPRGLAIDRDGGVLIGDGGNGRIRKISTGGAISTVAGSSTVAPIVDGSPATAVSLGQVWGMVVDAAGIVASGSTIRRVVRISTDGRLTTIAGNGRFDPIDGPMGDGGPGTGAGLWAPGGISANRDGELFFADIDAARVRRLTPNVATSLEIVSGNEQSGPVGQALDAPLVVRVNGRAAPVAGVTVAFAVASGNARLGAATTVTDTAGRAGVPVTFGATPGPVRVTATVTGLPAVTFNLTATAAAPPTPPAIARIVSAGGSNPPVTTLAPLGLANATGGPFVNPGVNSTAPDQLPLILANTCVQFANERTAVAFVDSGNVTFQVPQIPPGSYKVRVLSNCGQPGEIASAESDVTVAESSPEFFYWSRNADGKNPVAAADENGSPIGGPGGVPAKPDSIVFIAATGFGAKATPLALGLPSDGPNAAVLPVTVKLGDTEVPAENVVYAGALPGGAGRDLVALEIPVDAPDGDLAIVVTVGGVASPAGAFLPVKRE